MVAGLPQSQLTDSLCKNFQHSVEEFVVSWKLSAYVHMCTQSDTTKRGNNFTNLSFTKMAPVKP